MSGLFLFRRVHGLQLRRTAKLMSYGDLSSADADIRRNTPERGISCTKAIIAVVACGESHGDLGSWLMVQRTKRMFLVWVHLRESLPVRVCRPSSCLARPGVFEATLSPGNNAAVSGQNCDFAA